jgi:hypothetical protein
MTKEELLHRMNCISDDVKAIKNHLDNEEDFLEVDTVHGCTIYTHLENIRVAANSEDSECLTWELFEKIES